MRVPTYATYMRMTNDTIANKKLVDLYSYQSITGLKAQTYSGYGMSASTIVSLEAMLGVTNNFMENNKITEVEIKTMNTSMESIQDAINDFKSALTSFSGLVTGSTSTTTTDETGGELTFTSNDPADYLRKTIIIDGVTYTFANDATDNNIDINGATSAQDVMDALENKLPANADFDFNGTTFTYPLGTVANDSTIISANGVTTGEPITTTSGGQNLTPDYTGGEITFTNDNVADYMGKTITINGIQYTFADNSTGNNIDIRGATDAEGVMAALQAKLPANADFSFNGATFTFPNYTINGSSSVLNVSGVETGEPYTMSADQFREMQQLQQQAFTTLKMLVDSLNTFANGKYLFGGGVSSQPPVNIPFTSLDAFQAYYDGINIQYPSNSSADLSDFSVNADDTGAITLQLNGTNTNQGTITAANAGGFLKPVLTANDKTTGTLTFNSDKNTLNSTQYGAFDTLSAGDTIVLGGDAAGNNAKAYIIKSVSADGKTITFEESTPVVEDAVVNPNNDLTISKSFPGGFLKPVLTANDKTTGTLTFDSDKNTLNSTQYGAFDTLSAGDTIVLGGGASGNNAKAYIIKSVSADGKTITFEESTPVVEDAVVNPTNNLTISKSFPVGSVINMEGFNNNNIASQVQVTGISDDGTQLYVTVDPSRFPTTTIPASNSWSLSNESYYQGGNLDSEKRISENQTLNFDINAGDPAFEKLFRALGTIAQGNLVDTRNPADDFVGTIDSQNPLDRVNEALDLISEALFNAGENATVPNADIYSISAKINANYVVLNQTMKNQTNLAANMENNISSLKDVDKTEAATKLLLASQNLEASYAVLQQAMSLSLLNYMN